MKKQGIAFYLNTVAAVLGVAGMALAMYSNSISSDNALQNMGLVATAGIVAILLVIVSIVAPNRFGNHDPISAVSVLSAIALYSYVFGQCIIQRVMLVAGLFSFNSGNTAGWQVFYVTIAAVACLLVGTLFLIVGSFCKSVKTANA